MTDRVFAAAARSFVLAAAVFVSGVAQASAQAPAAGAAAIPAPSAAVPPYEVYAVRYGSLNYPVSSLIDGADPSRRLDLAMMVWVIRGLPGHTILVDAGFYRDKFIQQRRPTDMMKPSEALAELGIAPGDVTDIIVSHVHWDHADGLDLFPNAQVWIQKEEYEHHVGANGEVLDRTIDAVDAPMFAAIKAAGRMHLVAGDAQEIFPGITVYTGGKHTFQSQYASVKTPTGTIVLASDNMYLYENLETHKPIAQTLDEASNLAAQDRMRTIASDPRLIVPGHDPAVFERFGAAPGSRVVRIK
jgi:glyoxylase-like metal-dependent hydrolase (beta-lactamase superfamily II)